MPNSEAARRTVATTVVGCLVWLTAMTFGIASQAGTPMPSPPNPPAWLETQPLPPALLARARGWATVNAAALAGTLDADVLLVSGDWANVPAEALKVGPDGERRLLIAMENTATLPAAMAAMAAGLDGIAVPASRASGASHDKIETLVAELRKRDPDFLILLDLGDGLPPPDAALPHGDGLIVRNVLTDERGTPYPDDEAAARLKRLEVLRSRSLTVLVAEQTRDPETSAKLAERLKALGAIPFVSPVP